MIMIVILFYFIYYLLFLFLLKYRLYGIKASPTEKKPVGTRNNVETVFCGQTSQRGVEISGKVALSWVYILYFILYIYYGCICNTSLYAYI